jgi:hypothetical protein
VADAIAAAGSAPLGTQAEREEAEKQTECRLSLVSLHPRGFLYRF